MNTIYKISKNKDLESRFFTTIKILIITAILGLAFSCSDDECGYTIMDNFDCPNLALNIGDTCDPNGDGNLNGTVNVDCECIEDFTIIRDCPGFIQNGDFETLTGDPNTQVDQDVDLATNWKPLWQSGSLADLFNASSTNFGSGSFVAPTPASGTFAAMWIENSTTTNATFREGMFNELTASINANTGVYTLTFDYANMSAAIPSNDIKVGVYGVYFPTTGTLPANPTGINTPTNLDLFGAANTVLLGEITITSSTTNTWTTATFTVDSSTLSGIPTNGINHIMIANSHLFLPDFGRMFIGFDNFCLIN